jgi:hypothetical protein
MLLNRKIKQALSVLGMLLMLVSAPAWTEQAYYTSADEAASALIEAAKSDGSEALKVVLGPELEAIRSGDPVADKAARRRFVEVAEQAIRVNMLGDDRAELLLGPDAWPYPIPMLREARGWRFDIPAGKEELLNRRIGSNELHSIATLRAIVYAQYEYAAADPMNKGVPQYAQRIGSSEGRRDGLYWPVKQGEAESPLGPLVAEAVAVGYGDSEQEGPKPYYGYFYRLLTAQGPNAPGGAKHYLKDGRLTEGFALVAYPAVYGNSGVMSFLVNHQGLIYQKDLGADTGQIAAKIEVYDPDLTWTPVNEDE